MPAPYNWGAPVRRPGAFLSAVATGDDESLGFQVTFLDEYGQNGSIDFVCSSGAVLGDIVLPSNATVLNLADETIIAHARMAQWVHGGGTGQIPGSTEWLGVFTDESAIPDFQTAIGNVRVVASRVISEVEFEFDVRKKGTSSPTKTVRTDYGVFLNYRLDPREAARCIPGGVKYLFSNYVHNYPTTVLTQAQKDAICAAIVAAYGPTGLNAPWM